MEDTQLRSGEEWFENGFSGELFSRVVGGVFYSDVKRFLERHVRTFTPYNSTNWLIPFNKKIYKRAIDLSLSLSLC